MYNHNSALCKKIILVACLAVDHYKQEQYKSAVTLQFAVASLIVTSLQACLPLLVIFNLVER